MKSIFSLTLAISCFAISLQAQDSLLNLVKSGPPSKEYVTNAFKSTRVINGQSMEFLPPGVMDVRILHRFGPVNTGINNFFGLDQANMRLGFDYGISHRFMAGVGRSNFNKELDGFIKYRPVWQSSGPQGSPVSIILVTGITCNTVPLTDPSAKINFRNRLAFYYQGIIGRKFSQAFSFQVAPILVHRNLADSLNSQENTIAIGLGGRLQLSRRIAFVVDYHPIVHGRVPGTHSPLSMGFDIQTGGHVFQLHFSNSVGMNEKEFITNTTGQFFKGDIRFGFNLSRVFTIVKPKGFRK